MGDISLAWFPTLPRPGVDVQHAFVEVRVGGSSPGLSRAVAGGIPGTRGDSSLHHIRRHADHVCLAVDLASTIGEDGECVVVLDEDPGLFQDLECLGVDRVDIARRQHPYSETGLCRASGPAPSGGLLMKF